MSDDDCKMGWEYSRTCRPSYFLSASAAMSWLPLRCWAMAKLIQWDLVPGFSCRMVARVSTKPAMSLSCTCGGRGSSSGGPSLVHVQQRLLNSPDGLSRHVEEPGSSSMGYDLQMQQPWMWTLCSYKGP